jgi:hypothetical protein
MFPDDGIVLDQLKLRDCILWIFAVDVIVTSSSV